MDRDEFLSRVADAGAFESEGEVEAAVRATLGVLGAVLCPDEHARVASALPASLQPWLGLPEADADPSPQTFFARVGAAEGLRPGLAVEHAQAVGAALVEAASDELLVLLDKHLPELAATLLRHREPAATPDRLERAGHVVTHERDLAGGKPGSRHPVSTAAPRGGQTESVAASDDPHGDTKLSSARGVTQEREHETLAEGKPPEPKRPLAGDD